MELLQPIAQEIQAQVEAKFRAAMQNLQLEVPKDKSSFWEVQHNGKSLFHAEIGKFKPDYLMFRLFKSAIVDGIAKIRDEFLAQYLAYLGCQEETLEASLFAFIEKNDYLKDKYLAQQTAKLAAIKTQKEPRTNIDELIAEGARLMVKIHENQLVGQNFWFFFYGYDKFKGLSADSNTWPLVKLLLKITAGTDSSYTVEIDNTGDPDYHFYTGQTDFLSFPRTDILVINCRALPDYSRQLNIKVHIGSGDGDIFLGQYLNYESEGRIISGTVLLQRILPNTAELTPCVYHIKKLQNEGDVYTENVEDVDKSIVQYLHDKKANFRRTSLRAGHTLATLEKWLAFHNEKRQK